MQYYATVSREWDDLDNIQWLTLDNIGDLGDCDHGWLLGPAGLVGSGRAVGGMMSQVVGVTDIPGVLGIQLQRIVSRCKAEFFYVSYGDTELEGVESGDKYHYTEPSSKERTDRYPKMRYLFMLELDNIDEQRKKIIKSKN